MTETYFKRQINKTDSNLNPELIFFFNFYKSTTNMNKVQFLSQTFVKYSDNTQSFWHKPLRSKFHEMKAKD